MIGRLRQQPVRVDHQRHVRRLHRDLHVVEVDLAEQVELVHRRRDERLGRDAAVLLGHRGVERAGVDADADRDAAVLRFRRDELDVLGLADVAGVEAQRLHAGFHRARARACTGSGCRRRSAPASAARSARAPRRLLPRCTCSARCRSRPRRARRSARACRRRRRSSWSSSTAPRPARRRRPATVPTITWRVLRRGFTPSAYDRSATARVVTARPHGGRQNGFATGCVMSRNRLTTRR